ncbi:MAG: hypothetical protein LBL91_06440 [Lachnospiraceae bacterium]|jgi:DNA invertase Pin-like site-specific DNA recombinase|nr:hypothetical protein [Lachnospiraceae bacterium]
MTKGTGKWRKNEDDIEKVLALAKEGKIAAEISRETTISDKTIKRWCENAGVPLVKGEIKRPRVIDESVKEEVLKLIEEGKTVKEVEVSKNVSESSIKRWCKNARNNLCSWYERI